MYPYLIKLLFLTLFMMMTAISQGFELQGHRGTRGLMPENTLPAFAKALSIGVDTLELDTAMTRDHVVVISHDAQLNRAFTRDQSGQWLTTTGPRIKDLSFSELQSYDIGRLNPNSRYARRFRRQQAIDGTHIPRLKDVFDLVKKSGNTRVRFNIETKINPLKSDLTWPDKILVEAVINVIREAGMSQRVVLQSFAWRTLQQAQRIAPNIQTSYLSAEQNWLNNIERGHSGISAWTAGLDIDDFEGSVPRMIKQAGGAIWSPYYREVDAEKIKQAHRLGLKVIVWTVNDTEHTGQLMDMGVDGIISDYPDVIREFMGKRGLPVPAATPVIQ